MLKKKKNAFIYMARMPRDSSASPSWPRLGKQMTADCLFWKTEPEATAQHRQVGCCSCPLPGRQHPTMAP